MINAMNFCKWMCPTYVINLLDLSEWQVDDLTCTMIGLDSDICASLAKFKAHKKDISIATGT